MRRDDIRNALLSGCPVGRVLGKLPEVVDVDDVEVRGHLPEGGCERGREAEAAGEPGAKQVQVASRESGVDLVRLDPPLPLDVSPRRQGEVR